MLKLRDAGQHRRDHGRAGPDAGAGGTADREVEQALTSIFQSASFNEMRRFKHLIPIVVVVTIFTIGLIDQIVGAINCSNRGGGVIGAFSRTQGCAKLSR
ncbi:MULTISPECIES: hypothetical protein [Sphingobium]|uniref:Uncharacterized protein n=1 Tax=Sphingobium yanoikuyae TaxID=13690 RepID=A0A6M4G1G4_SPHYA|nr:MULTISPECIES: hypothetical protein [Sphingobium]QJR00716.1 hypothetical protein HH800_22210 [Sphingobium yanoikuyae]WQE09704.1 hypothetical protein U0025_20620 [Sphingobium yanoikuyae]